MTKSSLRALHVVSSLETRSGGIAGYVKDLCCELNRSNMSCAVWSSERVSDTTNDFLKSNSISIYHGTTADRKPSFNLMHTHGIWSMHQLQAGRYARRKLLPRIVSVHGMLESWALKQKKLKKICAWYLYQRYDLSKAQAIHATSEKEKESVDRLKTGVRSFVVPNGVIAPKDLTSTPPEKSREKTALFLGRIHPKKGLLMLAEAWSKARPINWKMLVIGPDEGGHVADVKKLVTRLGLSDSWKFKDTIEGYEKWITLRSSDLFILPTHSENFGNVIVESLMSEVPVLTTTGTPWHELADKNIGWYVQPNVTCITDALKDATSRSRNELETMGRRGAIWANSRFSMDIVAAAMKLHYMSCARPFS
jgi:glycosyltransferase involved in cell wall biosynthesis